MIVPESRSNNWILTVKGFIIILRIEVNMNDQERLLTIFNVSNQVLIFLSYS